MPGLASSFFGAELYSKYSRGHRLFFGGDEMLSRPPIERPAILATPQAKASHHPLPRPLYTFPRAKSPASRHASPKPLATKDLRRPIYISIH
jgi:hypothetical protein